MFPEPEAITAEQVTDPRGETSEPEKLKSYKKPTIIEMVYVPKLQYEALRERAGMSPFYCIPFFGILLYVISLMTKPMPANVMKSE